MSAPELSPTERAHVDCIEQAPDALGLREEVAEWIADHLDPAECPEDCDSRCLADALLPLIERREAEVLRNVADRLDVWEFPPGSDALEPMYRLVRTLRAEADRIGGAPDAPR